MIVDRKLLFFTKIKKFRKCYSYFYTHLFNSSQLLNFPKNSKYPGISIARVPG
jgi:hypothetical protein